MHPDVSSEVPGSCPKCGMKLVPAKGISMVGKELTYLLSNQL